MVAGPYVPDAGHLVKVDFEPSLGKEQAGRRPAIVLSPATYNAKTGLAVMAPITNSQKDYPFEVKLPAAFKKVTGVILADHVKNLDWTVRNIEFLGEVPANVLTEVREKLRLLLGLGTND
jgi:mRNA interferase MazF